jgi:hypothetical protein
MYEFLVNQDIEAQKAELGKKQNLLTINYQRFKNLHDATEMTRIQMNEITASKLKMEAAKTQDPLVKARALQAVGKLNAESQSLSKKMAMSLTVDNAIQQASQNPKAIPGIISAVRMIDPKRAENLEARYVPGMGIALTPEGATKVRELKGTVDTAKDGINELMKINKQAGKSLSLEDRAKAETIAQTMVGLLRTPITGPGAMSDGERAMLENIIANPTKIFSLDSSTKTRLQTLSKRLEQSLNMTGRANGIEIQNPVNALSPKEKQYLDWARNNPQDPRSKLIINKLGLE